MAVLKRFSTPGRVADRRPDAWSNRVSDGFEAFTGEFAQFYSPIGTDPAQASTARIVWSAFPASLRARPGRLFQAADSSRGVQDEYCEWGVERNSARKITRITFTTEVPEYFEHLFEHNRPAVLALYKQLIGSQVRAGDLERNGRYLRANKWNESTVGRPAHLIQRNNNLGAAIALAAEATILRQRGGELVTTKQELVECGGLGNPSRNSDPQIASAVNSAAAEGDEASLADPVGLYIDGLITGGMRTPDGTAPADFWTIERGNRAHILRASYEVPRNRGYVVGDITIGGQPIRFGSQLAVRVRVRLDALVRPGSHTPTAEPCVG